MSYPIHTVRPVILTALLVTAAALTASARESAPAPIAIQKGQISIAGSSNVHEWSATTADVRVTHAQLGAAVSGPAFAEEIVRPGALAAFEIAVPAASLKSGKDGLDKNMYKALKVKEHADITFRLTRLDPAADGAFKAAGVLRIAGVARDVVLDLRTRTSGSTLTVTGSVDLLMTDFGIKPPTAMLGMLKTDPKVTVTFETVLAIPLT
ncbi:MAG TPA: YceI family protein [Vicinamibacterales bacterium]